MPFGIIYRPAAERAYVAIDGAGTCDNVQVIDPSTATVTQVLSLGRTIWPAVMADDPDTGTIYIAGGDRRNGAPKVVALNTKTGTLTTTAAALAGFDQPSSVAVNPVTHTVFAVTVDFAIIGNFIDVFSSAGAGTAGTGAIAVPDNGIGYVAVDPAVGTVVYANRVGNSSSFVKIITLAAPAFTSASHAAFRHGRHGSFTVKTSALPVARVTEKGVLPAGLRFRAAGNGTATISGTPAAATRGKTYVITLTAENGFGKVAAQRMTLHVS